MLQRRETSKKYIPLGPNEPFQPGDQARIGGIGGEWFDIDSSVGKCLATSPNWTDARRPILEPQNPTQKTYITYIDNSEEPTLEEAATILDKLKADLLFGTNNDKNYQIHPLTPFAEQQFLQALAHIDLAKSLLTTANYSRMQKL